MKKFRILSAVLVLFTAFNFTACDSEPVDPVLVNNPNNPGNPNPGNPNPEQGVFKVDFNGQTYTATNTIAAFSQGVLAISGIRGEESVSIAVPAPAVGTFSGEEVILTYQPEGSEDQYLNINFDGDPPYSGTVTITEIDTQNQTISGTFEFTGWWGNDQEEVDPIEFTNGSFTNISYSGTMPGEGEDEVTANVDGSEFPVDSVIVATAESGDSATININAYDADLNSIVLSINDDLNPGTYEITSEPFADVRARYTMDGLQHQATSGTLVITGKTEDTITGTFEFTAEAEGSTVEVTIGSFDVSYEF